MKFKINKKSFLTAIRNLSAVVERRNSIAILGNMKIQIEGNSLHLFATDMDVEATQNIKVDGREDGATTVNAQTLIEIVSKLKDDDIDVSTNDASLFIKSGRSRFKLACLDAADFPLLDDGKYNVNFAIDANDLVSLIDNVKFCASTEESRYYLNGIYLHVSGNMLRSVATDGNRLALCDVAKPTGLEELSGVIIPSKTILIIRKILEGCLGDVNVSLSENKIFIEASEFSVTSKLIDGAYPDYDRVIPKSNDSIMVVNTDEFRGAIDRVSTVSDARSNSIKLAIGGSGVGISARNGDGSSATEDLEVVNTFGLEIGFNSKFFLDALAHVKSEKCTVKFGQAINPVLITDDNLNNFVYLIMPLRVS